MKTRSASPRHKCSCNDEFYAGILLELKDMVFRDVFRTAWRSGLVWGATKKNKRSIRDRRMMMIEGLSEAPTKAERRRQKKGGGGGGVEKKKRKSPDSPLDCSAVPKVLRIKFERSQTHPESSSPTGHEKVSIFDEKGPIFDDARSPAAAMTEKQAPSGMTTTTAALVGCSTRSTDGCLVEEEACADSCVKFSIPDLNIPIVLEDGLETEIGWR